ncbi:MAG TPA: hypothetical protein V6D29_11360 [Leptolyngbyaceae cyanobacterium]
MEILKQFEVEVVRLLAPSILSKEQMDTVFHEAEFVSYEHSESGYFLTIKHPILAEGRTVCSNPTVVGQTGAIDCGFVLFIENHELTLECHTWGDAALPDGFREESIHIMAL